MDYASRIEHLKLIQGVIDRLATSSFQTKSWSVTLVVALFALSAAGSGGSGFVCLAYFPALVFWGLDSYYLRQERLFRRLYDDVRQRQYEMVDYAMRADEFGEEESILKAVISPTVGVFHGVVVLSVSLVMLLVTPGVRG